MNQIRLTADGKPLLSEQHLGTGTVLCMQVMRDAPLGGACWEFEPVSSAEAADRLLKSLQRKTERNARTFVAAKIEATNTSPPKATASAAAQVPKSDIAPAPTPPAPAAVARPLATQPTEQAVPFAAIRINPPNWTKAVARATERHAMGLTTLEADATGAPRIRSESPWAASVAKLTANFVKPARFAFRKA